MQPYKKPEPRDSEFKFVQPASAGLRLTSLGIYSQAKIGRRLLLIKSIFNKNLFPAGNRLIRFYSFAERKRMPVSLILPDP
jgi:hypothetical protein